MTWASTLNSVNVVVSAATTRSLASERSFGWGPAGSRADCGSVYDTSPPSSDWVPRAGSAVTGGTGAGVLAGTAEDDDGAAAPEP